MPASLALLSGCQPTPVATSSPPTTTVTATAGVATEAPSPNAPPAVEAPSPYRLGDEEPLREGLVELEGVVRPTKGGLDVRGVTIALETLQRALPPQSRRVGYDDLLGTKLRVVAELEARHADPPDPDEPAIQSRGGDWLVVRELHRATVLEPAVMIEGEVARSKGLLAVGKHLVTRADLAWSLVGVDPVGKRVRLWGQPRVHVCHPQAQCLIGGEIPMFDVARAELLE